MRLGNLTRLNCGTTTLMLFTVCTATIGQGAGAFGFLFVAEAAGAVEV